MTRLFSSFVLLGMGLLLASGCNARDDMSVGDAFTQAQRLEQQGDFEQAVQRYHQAAENGHPAAQLRLADIYQWGTFYDDAGTVNGVLEQDRAAAQRWYEHAFAAYETLATQGDAEAQTTLGMLYATGKGTARDMDRARALWQQAADQGNAMAQYNLGFALWQEKNYSEAFTWLSEAAAQDQAAAQYLLATMYTHGHGVAPNVEEAVMWLRKAAANGNAMARRNLDGMTAQGLL